MGASFTVHPDMKLHAGSTFTLGKGSALSSSTKQKVNARSTTESELIAADDNIAKCMWTRRFIEHQGFKVTLNIIYQDNSSTIKLINNGKASSGKRTRHFDIRLFYVHDLVGRDQVKVECCPSDKMLADCISKPLVGALFKRMRKEILNVTSLY